LEDLAGQPLQLGREEAARLASQRRQDVHKQMEEEERLRQNPLRYLAHPNFRVGNLKIQKSSTKIFFISELAHSMANSTNFSTRQHSTFLLFFTLAFR